MLLADDVDELNLRCLVRQEVEREEIDLECSKSPLYWLQNHTKTEDPKYLEHGRKFNEPFPKKPYFDVVMRYMMSEKRLFIPKSREMMTSWLACGYATWLAQWRPGSEIIIQTEKESKVIDLVHYCKVLYLNQPDWLRALHPMVGEGSATVLNWADKSEIKGVPQGQHQIRHSHPTLYLLDEAAFLPECGECYDTAHPVAHQIIAVSSAGPGWFAGECAK